MHICSSRSRKTSKGQSWKSIKKDEKHGRTKLGLVADPVIEAIARLEFEDGSPPWRLLVPFGWLHLS